MGVDVPTVVKIATYRARDMIEILEELLREAKQGRVTGLVVAWKARNGAYNSATAGDYQKDYIAALGAASKLWSEINDAHNRT